MVWDIFTKIGCATAIGLGEVILEWTVIIDKIQDGGLAEVCCLWVLSSNYYYYVAAKATYIRLLHGKIGFLGGFSALAP